MRKIYCIITFLFSWHCWAQVEFELKQIDSVASKADFFAVDVIGYIYTSSNDIIEKIDTTRKMLFRSSVKLTGHISTIDVTNPLKPLLFFQAQQSISFIDNTLTPYQDIGSLIDIGISYATLVCYSEQFNRFWVYDQDNSKLTLFDSNGKPIRTVENLTGLIGVVNPSQLLEKNGILYMVDDKRGVYLFDMFGSLINFFAIEGIEWVQADETNMYYLLNGALYSKNIRVDSYFNVKLNANYQNRFIISKDQVYLKTNQQIDIFKIILNKKAP